MSTDTLAIGVDLGGTKIATALIDRSGRVLGTRQCPTRAADGPAVVCDRIAAEIRALTNNPAGIGIGAPGVVDRQHGVVRGAINLGWDEVHLAREIGQRLGGPPVIVENDANANAVGEGMFGSARGSRDYVLLTIGSGLGAGVVSDGRLITGESGIAADLGHYALDPDAGRECVCGHRGCAETIVSGPGLVAVMRSMRAAGPDLTPDAIVAAARRDDQNALAALDCMAHSLGHIAAVAAAVVNPDLIVIGGGLGVTTFDLIQELATRELYRRLPPMYAGTIQLRAATLASPAVGAASLVWSQQAGHGALHEKAG